MHVELFWNDEAGRGGAWVFLQSTGTTVTRTILKGIDANDVEGAKAAAVRAAEGPKHLDDPLAALAASIAIIKETAK